ncbi:hypothetical protein M3Y97_00560700 [Aphelenchoides bicaudatus]|nr:hypothetical protein M3Y97_00560700 [Aphelenchoides bicaudatus]
MVLPAFLADDYMRYWLLRRAQLQQAENPQRRESSLQNTHRSGATASPSSHPPDFHPQTFASGLASQETATPVKDAFANAVRHHGGRRVYGMSHCNASYLCIPQNLSTLVIPNSHKTSLFLAVLVV